MRCSRACALSLLGYADIMRAFRRGSLSNVGTNRVSVAHTVACTRVFAAIEMTSLPRGVLERAARGVAGIALAVLAATALAQVPIPVDEQIRLFNSMSPAQQQSLIRELQRSLPPAQREAIIGLLQGEGNGGEQARDDIDPESEAFLRNAIEGQRYRRRAAHRSSAAVAAWRHDRHRI